MDNELITELYRSMLLIRRFEEEAARLYQERKIGGFLHLYIGQEALAVGTASVLDSEDYLVTAYRCHGHYLARGGSARAGMAELLGKVTGCAEGRGGSMHFYDVEKKFMGGWGIVGAHMPLAAGFAFAQKYNQESGATICFLGDGAINIGPFHEAMSLAALWNLPVVFVIENNYFAMGTPLHKTSPTDDLSLRALGYPMARDTVDGHDVFAVRASIHAALTRAREQHLPTLIEAKTYRYRGHSMADPAKYRTKEEVEDWRKRDPILTLGAKLESFGLKTLRDQIDREIEEEILDAVKFAEESPEPDPSTAEKYVYVE
ncbi:MAG TPA: pyruvate dehydrogenase (acetyl-transferring) E1 component subunit alpha [Oligoflexia bacterium]|nr:pyruvate dehydrogenase (acetyl-transferring) E1 component subunit alpha [Oligoflexia bacterium]HMP26752.1 pyruvate dehydrogenase (acetyl-transferring) E1 component subunit alpha [Oligoflexia bacterium]